MEWLDIIKDLKEIEGVKIEEYTPLYKESISGGFIGALKEYPGVVSQADSLEELPNQLKLSLEAMKQAELYFKENKK